MIIKILLAFLAITSLLMLVMVTLLLANVIYEEFEDSELMQKLMARWRK